MGIVGCQRLFGGRRPWDTVMLSLPTILLLSVAGVADGATLLLATHHVLHRVPNALLLRMGQSDAKKASAIRTKWREAQILAKPPALRLVGLHPSPLSQNLD